MSAPDISALRMRSAAAASPPNPPPTMCAFIGFLHRSRFGKFSRPLRRTRHGREQEVVVPGSSLLDRVSGRNFTVNCPFDNSRKCAPLRAAGELAFTLPRGAETGQDS